MALQAMWAHGHSATIELNSLGRGSGEDVNSVGWTAIEGLRVGWGVEYRCQDNSDYWFHFPIPTPVIDDGVRARLRRVMVLFTAGAGVTLSSIHVWDGPTRVFIRTGLPLAELTLRSSTGGTHSQFQIAKCSGALVFLCFSISLIRAMSRFTLRAWTLNLELWDS